MKKLFAMMLALIMVLALVPTVAFAEEPKTIYVDATMGDDTNNGSKGNPYKTVEAAAKAAAVGIADINKKGESKVKSLQDIHADIK